MSDNQVRPVLGRPELSCLLTIRAVMGVGNVGWPGSPHVGAAWVVFPRGSQGHSKVACKDL